MNSIAKKYEQLGGPSGFLGKPIEVEHASPDGVGRFRLFEGGAICWHPDLGAHEIRGAIKVKWMESGGVSGSLRYPTGDELSAGFGAGRCSCFQKGRIYWTPEAGAWSTDLFSDNAWTTWISFNAKPLSPEWLEYYEDAVLPPKLDYSADINFTRNQQQANGVGYGCMTYALLHIVDILKDWEHPYSPAVSWRYAEWYWWDCYQRNGYGSVPFSALADQGFAFEGSCQTNWDTEFQWVEAPVSDSLRQQWHEPSQSHKEEAILNRVWIRPDSNWIAVKPGNPSPSVHEIKHFLRIYGPVWCGGAGHAKAIVGYDDVKQEFKILDSYVHDEASDGGRNITYIPYDYVHPAGAITAFSEVINIPNEQRLADRYAHTARIRINENWRGTYTVSIGVEGRQPLVVWTTRGRGKNNIEHNALPYETPLEMSRLLAIDVPLPDYAAECWPPNASHRWFLRVEDHDRDGARGRIKEFTLAHRYIHPACHSVGRYKTRTFGGHCSVSIPDPTVGPNYGSPVNPASPPSTPNPSPGTVTIHVPGQFFSNISSTGPLEQLRRYAIDTVTGHIDISTGIITLSGVLRMKPPVSMPVRNQEVELFELDQDFVNRPTTWWVPRAAVNTDSEGTFKFEVERWLKGKRTYAVAYSDAHGQVVASSRCIEIEIEPPVVRIVDLCEIETPRPRPL